MEPLACYPRGINETAMSSQHRPRLGSLGRASGWRRAFRAFTRKCSQDAAGGRGWAGLGRARARRWDPRSVLRELRKTDGPSELSQIVASVLGLYPMTLTRHWTRLPLEGA